MQKGTFDPYQHYTNVDVAERYDQERFSTRAQKAGHLREVRAFEEAMAQISNAKTALDAPCGTGRITKILLDRGLSVTGGDISNEMITVAKAKLESYGDNIAFRTADLRNLPFSDDSFDLVTCVRMFGHVPSEIRIQMLQEMRRVTRKWIIVNYFCLRPLVGLKRWIKRKVLRTYEGVGHPTSTETMYREIREAGLSLEYLSVIRLYSEEVYALVKK